MLRLDRGHRVRHLLHLAVELRCGLGALPLKPLLRHGQRLVGVPPLQHHRLFRLHPLRQQPLVGLVHLVLRQAEVGCQDGRRLLRRSTLQLRLLERHFERLRLLLRGDALAVSLVELPLRSGAVSAHGLDVGLLLRRHLRLGAGLTLLGLT